MTVGAIALGDGGGYPMDTGERLSAEGGPSKRKPWAFFLVFPPLIVFFGAFLMFDKAFGDCAYLEGLARDLTYAVEPITLCQEAASGDVGSKEPGEVLAGGPFADVSGFQVAGGRITWLTAAALALLIGIPGLFFVWRVIWTHRAHGHVVPLAVIVLLLFSGWLFIWGPTLGDPPRLDTRTPPFFPSVHFFNFHMTADLLHKIDPGFHAFAYRLYMICFSLLVAVVLSGMFAACYALWPVERDSGSSPAPIADRMALMRNMLYLGSLLLSVGIIFIGAWLNWPATLLPADAPLRADLSSLAGSVTMYWGAMLSALLLSVYVPSALCLRARARKLANVHLTQQASRVAPHHESAASKPEGQSTADSTGPQLSESVVKTFLQEHRLSLPFTNHVQQVIAVFAPALMGPLINSISAANILPG